MSLKDKQEFYRVLNKIAGELNNKDMYMINSYISNLEYDVRELNDKIDKAYNKANSSKIKELELQKRIDKAMEFLYSFFAEADGTIHFSNINRRQLIEILLGVDVNG